MKQNLSTQLEDLQSRYSGVLMAAMRNMRLILLVLFACLSAYLVIRIDTLVSGEDIAVTTDATTTSEGLKDIDQQVVDIFDELYVQDVSVNSQFESERVNPF